MTRLIDRLEPVPPLDQVTRLRLERTVLGQLELDTRRSPTRWRVAAFAAVVAVAVAVAVMWTWPGRSPARSPLSAERFASTDAVREVAWGDAHIAIEPGGALVATGDADRGVAIVLERGAAQFDVAKRKGRPRFTVIAGDVEVEVVGTRFRVERRADQTSVKVSEGVVVVRVDDQELRLGAGQQWPQRGSEAVPEATAEVEAPPIHAVAGTEPGAAPPAERSSSRARRELAKADPPPPPRVDKPAATPTPAETYAMAAQLEATDATTAAKHYAKLAARDDGWGATALYALARLRSDQGDRTAAARHLRAYLRRFPRGPNAEDARALLERLR